MRGHSTPCRIKTGRSVVGRKADDREAEPSLGSFDRMVDQKTWQQRDELFDRHRRRARRRRQRGWPGAELSEVSGIGHLDGLLEQVGSQD